MRTTWPVMLSVLMLAGVGCSSTTTGVRATNDSGSMIDTAPSDVAPDVPLPQDLPVTIVDASAPDVPAPMDVAPMDSGEDVPSFIDAVSIDIAIPDVAAPDVGPPDTGPVLSRDVHCGSPRPAGAPMPPPLPAYSGGMCPTLVSGHNHFMSTGHLRDVILVTPDSMVPGEVLPLLVMWHWLRGTNTDFLMQGNVQAAANAQRFVAVLPQDEGDVDIVIPFVTSIDMCWPYLTSSTEARIEEELTFFDDMVTCASQQFTIDQDCISSVGMSAGGLWTAQMLQRRADRLANAIVLSGGIGPVTGFPTILDIQGWESPSPSHALPTMVLWGGPNDDCAIGFQNASHNLETRLQANGSFIVECIHNCGHSVPPVTDPALGVGALYQFAVDHPYWLNPGESVYNLHGLPASMPEWCAIGAGRATERVGTCAPPACDILAL